jgi:hypothetical protein
VLAFFRPDARVVLPHRTLSCAAGVALREKEEVARYDESPLSSWVTAEATEGAVGSRAVTFRRVCHHRSS